MAHVKLRPLVAHDPSNPQSPFMDPCTPDMGPPTRPPSVLSPTSRHKALVPAPPDGSNGPAEDPGVSKIRSKLRRLLGTQGQGLNQSVGGQSGAATPSLSKSGSFRSTVSVELHDRPPNSATASPHRSGAHTPTVGVPRGRFASAIIVPNYPHPPPTTPPGSSTPVNSLSGARPTPPLQPPPTASMAPPGSPAAAAASVRGLTLRRAVSFSPTTTFPPLSSPSSSASQQTVPMVMSSSGVLPGPGAGNAGGGGYERPSGPRTSYSAGHPFQATSRSSGMLVVPEDEALPEQDANNSEPGVLNTGGRCGQFVEAALRNSVSADTESAIPAPVAVDGTVYVLAPPGSGGGVGGGGMVRQGSMPTPPSCAPESGRVIVRNSNSGRLSISSSAGGVASDGGGGAGGGTATCGVSSWSSDASSYGAFGGAAAVASAALLESPSLGTPQQPRNPVVRGRASGSASGGSGANGVPSGPLRMDPSRASLSSPAATPRGPFPSAPHPPTPPSQPHPPQPPSISLPLQPTQPTQQFLHHLAYPLAQHAMTPPPPLSSSGQPAAQAPSPTPSPPPPTLTRGMSALNLVAAGSGRGGHASPGSAWSTGAGGGAGLAVSQQAPSPHDTAAGGGGASGGAAAAAAGGAPVPGSAAQAAQSVRRTHSTLDATAIRAQPEIVPSTPAGSLMAIGSGIPSEMRRKEWRMEDFTLLKKLYKGNYSAVHKALCRISMRLVVVKVYDTTRMTELARNHVRREAALHAQLDHDNILNLYAVFSQGPYVLLIEEVAEGGDLYHVLKGVPGHRLQEDRAVIGVLLPLLRSLAYLHEQGICHRDIKLENILFSDRHHTHMLLADFGIALSLRQERAVTRAGTTEYMSPEQLRCPFKRHPSDNKDRTDLHYGLGVDVWATGVLAYELLHGYPPFLGANREETEQLIATAAVQVAPQLSTGARDFVISCLQKDPSDRPTVQQLLQHPWLRSHMRQPRN